MPKYSSSIVALLAKAVEEADRDCIALVMPSPSTAKWLSSPRAPCDASGAAAVLGRLTVGALLAEEANEMTDRVGEGSRSPAPPRAPPPPARLTGGVWPCPAWRRRRRMAWQGTGR